jgi:hypothetical protein
MTFAHAAPGEYEMRMSSCKNLLASTLMALAACTPFDTKLDSWIGRPIDEKPSALPMEIGVPDSKGNRIYTERVGNNEDCVVYWTVNREGVMVAWKHEGRSCRSLTF